MRSHPLASTAALLLLTALTAGCGGDGGTGPQGPAPTISSVTPATGTVTTELTITGTNFRAGAQVFVGTFTADSVEVSSSITIFALVPSGVSVGQSYAVRVRNSDGTEAQLAGAFSPVAPLLQYVNGATQPSGNVGSTVIVEGRAFGDRQGTGQIRFSDGAGGSVAATIASPGDWTNTFVLTTVPNGAATGNLVLSTGTGSDTIPFTVTSNATFSPSTINWTSTTSLPVGVSGHDAAFAIVGSATLVYVTGGAANDSVPTTSVTYAAIQAAGGLGAWATTAALPAGRAFHASVVATPSNSRVLADSGSLYVLGGASDKTGIPTTTVYRGRLNSDGSVRDWVTTTPLPIALHSAGAVIFRGEIYIAGGATTGNAPVSGVYRARIDSTGMLRAWQALPALPSARSHHGFVLFGRFLYAIGGATDSTNPNNGSLTAGKTDGVVYAAINLRTGDLAQTSWTVNSSSLTKAASKHTVVAGGGNAFVTAGLYNGANVGSTENTYAVFNADGTVGSFSGATGSNTIQSAGGGNLFNHAALSYIDANGVAHVMILGGDDVNSPGTKRAGVWFY
jgi:hypothetical protein